MTRRGRDRVHALQERMLSDELSYLVNDSPADLLQILNVAERCVEVLAPVHEVSEIVAERCVQVLAAVHEVREIREVSNRTFNDLVEPVERDGEVKRASTRHRYGAGQQL